MMQRIFIGSSSGRTAGILLRFSRKGEQMILEGLFPADSAIPQEGNTLRLEPQAAEAVILCCRAEKSNPDFLVLSLSAKLKT